MGKPDEPSSAASRVESSPAQPELAFELREVASSTGGPGGGHRLEAWFAELRRRRVFRVAVAYGIAGFGLLQVADVVVRALRFPEWTLTLLVVLTGLGLPLSLVLAWVFDLTSHGVVRTAPLSQPAAPPEVAAAFPSRAIGRLVLAALVGAIVAVGAVGLYLYVQPGGAAANAVKSLIVLPFINASANPDTEYLSDGLAESLIDSLSQIPELQVIARNTAFRYKGNEGDLQRLGRELSVDAVLMGRVQQRGGTLVVHADLVSLRTGSQLWGEKYNRKLTDLLTVEEDIAKAISDKLRPRLTAEVQHRVSRRYTDNPEAYQLYLRGRSFWNKRTKETLNRGIEYFRQAIEVDPNYALAYAGLADSYTLLAYYGYAPSNESHVKAEAAAVKALALDDELAEAHASLGNLKLNKWDWLNAEKELKRAIALNPNYAASHNWYGLYLLWTVHIDQAVAEFTRGQQLDPASAVYGTNLGSISCYRGEYDRGLAQFRDSLQLDPNAFTHFLLALSCYLPKEMYQEAIDELKQALALNPTNTEVSGTLAHAYALWGNKDRALIILKELKERDEGVNAATAIAQVYVGLDDKDRAFEWLEKAYQRRSRALVGLKIHRIYDPLRSDPRFTDLVRRIGFPP